MMQSTGECIVDMVATVPNPPEFEQILDEFGALVNRLYRVRESYVTISDALIGVQGTCVSDECAKPMPPQYFVARCSGLIVDFRDEIERLEEINMKMLHSVMVE